MHTDSEIWAEAIKHPELVFWITAFAFFLAALVAVMVGMAIRRVRRVVRETPSEKVTIEFRDG